MAAPTKTATAVTDGFNRADGALGTNWTTPMVTSDPAPVIHSNAMQQRSGDGASAIPDSGYWKTAFTGGRYEMFFIETGNAWFEMWFFISTGNGYRIIANATDNTLDIWKIVSGTSTKLKSYGSCPFTGSGEVPYAFMENEGAGVHIYVGVAADGVNQNITYYTNVADSSFGNINSVNCGVRLGSSVYSTSATWGEGIDNFHAGAVASPSVTVVAPPAIFTAQSAGVTIIGPPVVPAPTLAGFTSAGPASGTTVACPACAAGDSVAVGDLLVASFYQPNAGNNVSGITDTQGNTWTFANRNLVSPGNLSSDLEQWYCVVTHPLASTDTVTVTVPASQANKVVIISHLKGCSSTPLDQMVASAVSNNSTAGVLTSSSTPATTQAVEAVVAMWALYMGSAVGVPAITPGSGYTYIGSINYGPSNSIELYVEFKTVSSTSTQNASISPAAGNVIMQYQWCLGTYMAQTAVNATVVAPPATFSGSAVAPVLIESPTIVAPPAILTNLSVAPLVTVSVVIIGQGPSRITMSAVAPVVSGTALVVAPPAFFSMSSVAPSLTISPLILPPAATFTAQSVGPGLGRTLISVPAYFTAGAVRPAPRVDVTLFPNAIGWTANQMGSIPVVSVLPNAALFTASSVAPFPFLGVYVFATAAQLTAQSVAPNLLATWAAPAAQFSASSVAPNLTRTFLPTPAVASFATVAPQLALQLPAVAAVTSYFSVAPSFVAGSGMALSVPAASFVASATAPATSLLTNAAPAQFTASSATPVLIKTLVVPVAQVTMSSVAPNPVRSPLVLPPAATVTMSAGVVSISLGVFAVAPNFTTGASAPILSNGLAVTFGMFTASAPVVNLLRVIPAPASVTSFSSVAGQLTSVITVPAGVWTASLLTPGFAFRVATPAGMLYFFPLDHSLNIEKRMFPDAARWTATGLAPKPGIQLTSPAAAFNALSAGAIMSKGQVAIPAQATFSAPSSTLAEYSPPATYYYTPGDIIESNAWSLWQH